MNFLAHAWLASSGNDDFLYGNLVADGVKGSDLSAWTSDVAYGIRHHRKVDAWVDQHPSVLGAKQRAPEGKRRYAGIALDIVWDHFLARDKAGRDEQQKLVTRCYDLLSSRSAPNRLEAMVPYLVEHDWLRNYADFEFTCNAVAGLGRRLSGPNRLAELIPWLHRDYALLEADFQSLWPALSATLSSSGRNAQCDKSQREES
ncbi:acyl carrier protein phosphodiesterase [Vreelandella zhanjiangensis]|uniref:acyl carrier protein phosphodiesterase n=1 Tax=Vreelandella zhanjiangensis TaxID=1121960 RepID=UPI00402ADBBD